MLECGSFLYPQTVILRIVFYAGFSVLSRIDQSVREGIPALSGIWRPVPIGQDGGVKMQLDGFGEGTVSIRGPTYTSIHALYVYNM